METVFSGNKQKNIPRNFEECVRIDPVSEKLWTWTERLDRWGKILCIILIILGVCETIGVGIQTFEQVDGRDRYALALKGIVLPSVFGEVCKSLVNWGIYVLIEFIGFRVLVILWGALASISQNTVITANIAILNADNNEHTPRTPVSADSAQGNFMGAKATVMDDKWVCGNCKTANSLNYSQCKKCGRYRST